jgi:hypothetical protein
VELETFSGDIHLMRPAEISGKLDRLMKAREEKEAEKAMRKRDKKPDHDDHDHDWSF